VAVVELGTFGAILKYAIDAEDAATNFYAKLSEKADGESKALLSGMSGASKKGKQTLERVRRMEMQEMILEAITGLDTVNYECKYEAGGDLKEGLKNAAAIENAAAKFYADAAAKLGFLGNTKNVLIKRGKEREERGKKLQAFL
jgi:rubrerythrin